MSVVEKLEAALLASAGATALGSMVEKLARQWTAETDACEDVNVMCNTLRGIVARAIANVVSEWNSRHDLLRVLPPELQESALGRVPVSDRCRLPVVCSYWSRKMLALPGIWNCLGLTDWKPEVDALRARSGHLPLDLTVHTRSNPTPWDRALHPHSHRLRSLTVHHINGYVSVALGFPAPHLEKLTIIAGPYTVSTISKSLFDQNAPHLRSLYLTCLPVPLVCPAFGSVTTLSLRGSRRPLSHLFVVLPRLEILELYDCGYSLDLPALPLQSALRVLRLVDTFIPVHQLVQLGYASRVDVLESTTTTEDVNSFINAVRQWPEIAATVRVHSNWEFDLVQQPAGRHVRFAVRPHHYGTFPQVLCSSGANYDHITRLVLPFSFRAAPCALPKLVLLAREDVVTLHGLRTLALECRSLHSGDKVLPLRECILGRFDVPQLARIEVLKADTAAHRASIEPVAAAALVELVNTVLIHNDRCGLELFIDGAGGIVLEGDVDELKNCVGRLLM